MMEQWAFLCVIICAMLHLNIAQYQIPTPLIEALHPKGLRVSIPDAPGLQRFAFHGSLNEALTGTEPGQFVGDINKPTNGRWEFVDPNIQLEVGDVIYYWVFVQNDRLGYRREDERFTVQNLLPAGTTARPVTATRTPPTPTSTNGGTPAMCNPTVTRVNGESPCRGQLIFEENFNTLDLNTKWQRECRMADDKDYEFVSYQTRPENAAIEGGKLHIVPTLLDSDPESERIQSGDLDLNAECAGGCTAPSGGMLCARTASGFNILPPIVSASLRTRSFAFQYGRVEIRARLPKGDWLFPELYLEPRDNAYGEGYQSGRIRVAFSRGNVILSTGSGRLIDGRELSGGLLFAQFGIARNYSSRNYIGNIPWSDAFHKYELIWTPDKITLKVDGTTYGTVSPPNEGFKTLKQPPFNVKYADKWTSSKMAPFDKEMYISLGVGCGGVTDFPDGSLTRNAMGGEHEKPWRNLSPKAMYMFWRDIPNWHSTWTEVGEGRDGGIGLQVDHVRVWAL